MPFSLTLLTILNPGFLRVLTEPPANQFEMHHGADRWSFALIAKTLSGHTPTGRPSQTPSDKGTWAVLLPQVTIGQNSPCFLGGDLSICLEQVLVGWGVAQVQVSWLVPTQTFCSWSTMGLRRYSHLCTGGERQSEVAQHWGGVGRSWGGT